MSGGTILAMTPAEKKAFFGELRREADMNYASVRRVNLAGHVLKLVFHDRRLEKYAMTQLAIVETDCGEPDIEIHCMISDAPWRLSGAVRETGALFVRCGEETVMAPVLSEEDTYAFVDGGVTFLG